MGTLVGSKSWFVSDLDPAPHRRSGQMSPVQRRRVNQRPRRSRRGGYVASTRRVFRRLRDVTSAGATVTVIGDGPKAYDRALRDRCLERAIIPEGYPNPARGPKGSARSDAARRRDERLFPVDLLHKILRHSLAHQRRQTIAFGRRLNAVMGQMFLTAVWRHFVQRAREIVGTLAARGWSGSVRRRTRGKADRVKTAVNQQFRGREVNEASRCGHDPRRRSPGVQPFKLLCRPGGVIQWLGGPDPGRSRRP